MSYNTIHFSARAGQYVRLLKSQLAGYIQYIYVKVTVIIMIDVLPVCTSQL